MNPGRRGLGRARGRLLPGFSGAGNYAGRGQLRESMKLDIEVPDDSLVSEWHPGRSGSPRPSSPAWSAPRLRDRRWRYPAAPAGGRARGRSGRDAPSTWTPLASSKSLETVCGFILTESSVDRPSITVIRPASRGSTRRLRAGRGCRRRSRPERPDAALVPGEHLPGAANLSEPAPDGSRHVVVPVRADRVLDPTLGLPRATWSVLFPGLSDEPTASRATARRPRRISPTVSGPRPTLMESSEVSWLLGCRFHLGIIAGCPGPAEIVAGLQSAPCARPRRASSTATGPSGPSRARPTWWSSSGSAGPGPRRGSTTLAAGLTTAARLVRHGGKIVALSRRRRFHPGPALSPASLQSGRPEARPRTPARPRSRGRLPGRHLAWVARALAWADVFLWSALDPEIVADLSMIVLDRPEEAARLDQG